MRLHLFLLHFLIQKMITFVTTMNIYGTEMNYTETTVEDSTIIKLPAITSNRKGNLTPIYSNDHVNFHISRVYYLYDVPGGAERGGHAHRNLRQLIVAASGSFDVLLDDGFQRRTVALNRPYIGLYLPQLIWREINNFSSGGICLVLASHPYDPDDYIYDYNEFRRIKGSVLKNTSHDDDNRH